MSESTSPLSRETATGPVEMTLLRLEPGEEIVSCLLEQLDEFGAPGAAVVSAIGSLTWVEYALAEILEDGNVGYSEPHLEATGTIELAALQGHLGRELDGTPTLHLHGVFGLADGTVLAGHLFGAKVLITLEIALMVSHDAGWQRGFHQGVGTRKLPIFKPWSSVEH